MIDDTFISYDRLEYIIKKLPVSTKRATIFLIKVKLCSVLLRMLLACFSSYSKSVLSYIVSVSDTYHLETLHLREQGYEDLWLFSNLQSLSEQKFWDTLIQGINNVVPKCSP